MNKSLKRYCFVATMCGLILITFRLGIWQVHRAHEKETILSEVTKAHEYDMVEKDRVDYPPYTRLTIKGTWLPQFLLLDNQFHNHQLGFHVLAVLHLETGKAVLVDRGFIKKDELKRADLHTVLPKGTISIQGHVYYPSSKQWLLGPLFQSKSGFNIVEILNLPKISEYFDVALVPFMLREENGTGPFTQSWSWVSMPPERHFAYAVQWFALSLSCLLMLIYFMFFKL